MGTSDWKTSFKLKKHDPKLCSVKGSHTPADEGENLMKMPEQ